MAEEMEMLEATDTLVPREMVEATELVEVRKSIGVDKKMAMSAVVLRNLTIFVSEHFS